MDLRREVVVLGNLWIERDFASFDDDELEVKSEGMPRGDV
jgi:hypothetical protein